MNNLFQTVKKKPSQSNICLYDTLEKNYFTNNLEEQLSMNRLRTMVEIIAPPIRTPTISMASTKEGKDHKEGKEDGKKKLTILLKLPLQLS